MRRWKKTTHAILGSLAALCIALATLGQAQAAPLPRPLANYYVYGGVPTFSGTGCAGSNINDASGGPDSNKATFTIHGTTLGRWCDITWTFAPFVMTSGTVITVFAASTDGDGLKPCSTFWIDETTNTWINAPNNPWFGTSADRGGGVSNHIGDIVSGLAVECGFNTQDYTIQIDAVGFSSDFPTSTPTPSPTSGPTPTNTDTPIGPSATPTNAGPTPTGQPGEPGSGSHCYAKDCNMEADPSIMTSFWDLEGTNNNGRFVGSWLGDLAFGSPYCGIGYQVIGGSLFNFENFPTYIAQDFVWDGGVMFVQYHAEGDRYSNRGGSNLDLMLTDLATGTETKLVNNVFYHSGNWTEDFKATNQAAGHYRIKFSKGASNTGGEYIRVDDIWVDHTRGSACHPQVPTPTATSRTTSTPTRTATPTGTWRSPTPGPSSTARNVDIWNCDFERNDVWHLDNASIERAGGPIGPQFGLIPNPTGLIWQPFFWSDNEEAYLTFWIGPNSNGEIDIRDTSTGVASAVWSGTTLNEWKAFRAHTPLPVGSYKFEAQAFTTAGFRIDGVALSHNDYALCGSPSPTAGPTSFVTPSDTPTATAGPSSTSSPTTQPTASNTPNLTWTPSKTYTPNPTGTPQPTETPGPTSTITPTPGNGSTATSQVATSTSAAAATSTAHSATSTALASVTAPAATGTAMPNPGPQPEPGPSADCQRPDNPLNLAWWLDYEVCRTLTWFVWSPDNTNEMQTAQATLQAYEPLGALNEMGSARDALQKEVNRFNWSQTGMSGITRPPDLGKLFNGFLGGVGVSGLLAGNMDLQPGHMEGATDFVTNCSIQIASSFGQAMGRGFCGMMNWLRDFGILGWLQFFFDIAIWIAFVRYIWHFLTIDLQRLL